MALVRTASEVTNSTIGENSYFNGRFFINGSLKIDGKFEGKSLLDVIKEFYANERFIRVSENLPTTKQVSGTNFCDITVREVRGRIIVISAIDNLIKGASGAAVQNFNLMYGFKESTSLL